MPESELSVIREMYRAVNEGDWDRSIELWAQDAVLEVPVGGVNPGVFEGRDRIVKWFTDWFTTFAEGATFELSELSELEDGSILAISEHRARGRGSGVEVTAVVVWRDYVEHGKIVRQIAHNDREEAIAAASKGAGSEFSL